MGVGLAMRLDARMRKNIGTTTIDVSIAVDDFTSRTDIAVGRFGSLVEMLEKRGFEAVS